MTDVAGDLAVGSHFVIPAAELQWRFSRSSGPGGQSVNTTDSRVEVLWHIPSSAVVTDPQRRRLLAALDGRLTAGAITVAAAEERSQWQNRRHARVRLAQILSDALRPHPRRRRRTRPRRGAVERRLAGKRNRADVKRNRAKPSVDD